MSSIQAEIELCRKEHQRQKKLEAIVSHRKLERPDTKKWHVILLLSIIPFVLFLAILFTLILPTEVIYKILFFLLLLLIISEIYVRFCLIQIVKCYQHYAKDETRKICMCIPSCSEYAIISLKRVFPLPLAIIKARRRLYKTCKGQEYRLDFPLKKMDVEFEKKYLN